jgi:hypothetical protein
MWQPDPVGNRGHDRNRDHEAEDQLNVGHPGGSSYLADRSFSAGVDTDCLMPRCRNHPWVRPFANSYGVAVTPC